jgi:arsenical-resistance protein 2
MAATTTSETPWHAVFPIPQSQPASISAADVLSRLQSRDEPGKDILLIDLRRTDHEGGTIRGSLNLPAQTLYHSLDVLYTLCENARVGIVIFYCGNDFC